jgi:prepilin-type processing-associated H-X9-DG protein
VPSSEWAIWSPVQNLVTGKWYKQGAWNHSADRALAMDSYLWLLQFWPAASAAAIRPQFVGRTPDYNAGGSTIDRYRHGKLPGTAGSVFDKYGGQVGFNVLFCDGHVEGLKSIADGFKSIRMRGF